MHLCFRCYFEAQVASEATCASDAQVALFPVYQGGLI